MIELNEKMMNEPSNSIEQLWDAILSRQPQKIKAIFERQDHASRQNILAHLQKMTTEDAWHPEQCASAKTALNTLKDITD